ncbi:MAG: hypothetical protein JNL64_06380 [Blastocatellia bacterium]|nr:hypothetical protein [Blastocatellia bacterium]
MKRHSIAFNSYGVKFSIVSNDVDLLASACKTARSAMLGNLIEIDSGTSRHELSLELVDGGVHFKMNGQDHGVTPWPKLEHFFDTCVRILVAEFAEGFVFLHCGVVEWNGKSILFPGDSFTGKTTIVAEFVKRGAVYYSDEYAIVDREGLVHPFARPLSIRHRTDLSIRFDTPAETLGSTVGAEPIPIDFIFLLNYRKNAHFRPRSLSLGEGVMQLMPQAIPLRVNPKFTLLLLNKICERAKVFRSNRGNSKFAVNKIIDLIDKIGL